MAINETHPTWGGKRENQNGRPKLDITRKMRSTRALDEEWDLAKRFLELMKNGYFAECEAFVKEMENND